MNNYIRLKKRSNNHVGGSIYNYLCKNIEEKDKYTDLYKIKYCNDSNLNADLDCVSQEDDHHKHKLHCETYEDLTCRITDPNGKCTYKDNNIEYDTNEITKRCTDKKDFCLFYTRKGKNISHIPKHLKDTFEGFEAEILLKENEIKSIQTQINKLNILLKQNPIEKDPTLEKYLLIEKNTTHPQYLEAVKYINNYPNIGTYVNNKQWNFELDEFNKNLNTLQDDVYKINLKKLDVEKQIKEFENEVKKLKPACCGYGMANMDSLFYSNDPKPCDAGCESGIKNYTCTVEQTYGYCQNCFNLKDAENSQNLQNIKKTEKSYCYNIPK